MSLLCLRQTPGSKPPAQDSAPFSAEQPGINMSTGSHTEAVPWSQCHYSWLCLPPGAVSPGRPKSGLSDLSSDNNRMTMGPFGPPPPKPRLPGLGLVVTTLGRPPKGPDAKDTSIFRSPSSSRNSLSHSFLLTLHNTLTWSLFFNSPLWERSHGGMSGSAASGAAEVKVQVPAAPLTSCVASG